MTKVILKIIIIIVLFFLFNSLEFDLLYFGFSKFIHSGFLTLGAAILILWPKHRFMILTGAFVLLVLMIVCYLLKQLYLANYLGSIGLGLLTITSLFCLKDLVRYGYID